MSQSSVRFEGTERFVVVQRLGAGGMGVVYEAHDRERNTRVALKTLRELDGAALLRFKNEFRAMADLQHENLVRLGELQAGQGTWFFTMELVHGCDFLAYVRPGAGSSRPNETSSAAETIVGAEPRDSFAPETFGGVLDERRLRRALAQLATGLHALHSAGMIHRDVKPSNVLVTGEGRVVLVDFGLVAGARDLAHEFEAFAGTVAYMAPEQAFGAQVGPEADWYAMGVMLYESLTGRVPFHGSAFEILSSKKKTAPEDPRALAPGAPEDLCALCVDLLRPDPAERVRADEILRRLGAKRSMPPPEGAPFVGRDRELEQLHKAWLASREGHAVTVYVHGESGVGKTALVRTFAARLEQEGAEVLTGRCYERESVPYKAVDGVVDALSRLFARSPRGDVLDLLPPSALLAAQLFPVLGRHFDGEPPSSTLDPVELRARAFAALREIFDRVARKAPLVVIIDDLQWADPDSLVALRDIMTPPAPPLLLIATVRTGPAGESARSAIPTSKLNVGASVMPGDVRDVSVGRLGRYEALELAQLTALRLGAAFDASAAIAEESGGHPLFIDELARHAAIAGRAAPVKLEDAVWARIQAQSERARELIRVACVAGSPLPRAAAARAARIEDADVFDRAIAALRTQHLLRTTTRRGAVAIEPYHDRVRRAVLDGLGEGAPEIHRRIALALEDDGSDHEALAAHWLGAGERPRAHRHALAAAEGAHAALAFDRAARLYAWAIDIDPPPPAQLWKIERRRAEALTSAGRGHEAARAFLAAAEHAGSEALELKRRASEQLLSSGRVDEGLTVLRDVLAHVGLEMTSGARGAVASIAWRRARLALRGLSFKDRAPDPSQLQKIDVCWTASMGLGFVDTLRAADFHLRGLLLALSAGDARRAARALAIEATYVAAERSERGNWRALLARARELAQKANDPGTLGLVRGAEGLCAYFVGDLPTSRRACEESIRVLREARGVSWQLDLVRHFWLRGLWLLGELRALAHELEILLRDAENRGDLFSATNLRTGYLNMVWLVADDPETARAELDIARSSWSTQGVHVQHVQEVHARASVDLYEGSGEAALRRLDAAWEGFERAGHLRIETQRAALLGARARACIAAHRKTKDRALLARATADANDAARTGVPWALATAALLRGCVAEAAGDRERARASFEIAIRDLSACSLVVYAEIARRRAAELDESSTSAIDERLRARGVKKPELLARVLAP